MKRLIVLCIGWLAATSAIFAVTTPAAMAGYFDFVNSLNPTAYYRLDETSQGTVSDSSGNGHDAVHVNTPSLDQAPGALDPHDTNSAIGGTGAVVQWTEPNLSNVFADGSNPFSLSIWVKPSAFAWSTPLNYGSVSSHQGFILTFPIPQSASLACQLLARIAASALSTLPSTFASPGNKR